MVDDASGDDTLATLNRIRETSDNDWVKVIALQRHGGPGAARNAAWESAGQPYLAFLDADDTWHPRKLEIQYGWMARHPGVALTGHPCEWSRDGAVPAQVSDEPRVTVTGARQMLMSNRFQTPSVVLKRELPLRFPTDMHYCEDYLLWCRLLLSGYPAQRLETALASLHKPAFGAGGLSARLWAMETGELEVYRRLRRSGLIRTWIYPPLATWSLIRYLRRLLLSVLRNRSRKTLTQETSL